MSSLSGFNLRAIRAGLQTILEDISGVSVALATTSRAVSDDERSWVMADPETQASITFKITSVNSVGVDECRYELEDGADPAPGDPETRNVLVNVCGNRTLTVSIRCECFEGDFTAFEYIEKIRSNLSRPSVLATIAALGCSLNDITGARSYEMQEDGRTVSCAGLDLILNTVSNLADTPVVTIETVDVTQEISL